MSFPRASQALSRFTVLDLTRVRSGPTCVHHILSTARVQAGRAKALIFRTFSATNAA
jgi:hypothetical protein